MKHNPPHLLRFLARLLLGLTLLLSISGLVGSFALVAHAEAATIINVTTCDESHLDQAIYNAGSGDTITFGCSGDITLTQPLGILKNLTLDGSGQNVTLDGQDKVRVFIVNPGVTFTLNALTIAHGYADLDGGGIFNNGTVTISNSTFTNNSVATAGGGLFNYNTGTATISNSTFSNDSASINGGGLYNTGTMSISDTTFANNTSPVGGGLINAGTMSISNSTIANNSATQTGGGLLNNGTMSISNSTIANNTSTVNGGGILNYAGTATISNSIVANNSGGNCYQLRGATITDQGYNLSSDSTCSFIASTSQQNTDPKLDPNGLQSNGGPTQTIALQQGSPAIDQIPVVSCPSSDQRGTARPDDNETTCDIGAYESTFPPDDDLGLTNMPANINTNATSPQGAVVTYTPPTVVDEDNPLPPVACTPASGSTFVIGMTTVTCTVSDSDDINSPVSQSFTVTVQPVLSVTVNAITATEGSSFSGVVATGTAYGTTNPLSASIAWGDGSTSAGSVTLNPDGSYSVSGGHTYAEEGSYPVSVTVKDSGSLNATGNGTATVSDAALTLTHFAVHVLTLREARVNATFTDADPAGKVSDYTATIAWGDGVTSTVKVSRNLTGKGFVLARLHKYASKGTYTVKLTVTDQGGSFVSQSATITVK